MNRRDFTKWIGLTAASAALPLPFGCSTERNATGTDVAGTAMADGPQSMNLDPRSPDGFDMPLRVPGYGWLRTQCDRARKDRPGS